MARPLTQKQMGNRNLSEVIDRLDQHGALLKGAEYERHRAYKNCDMKFYGFSVPLQRKLSSIPYSFSSQNSSTKLSEEDLISELKTWDGVWKSTDIYEVRSQVLLSLEKYKNKSWLPSGWHVLNRWAKDLNNWAHSDGLSDLYARILEIEDDIVYPTLLKWNGSPNPWLRRQSVVSLLYYSSARKRVLAPSKILPLAKNLLGDRNYYVQKGVGWCLRELGNRHPKDALKFLQTHIEDLSSIAFSTASEKLSTKIRVELKKQRR